MSVLGWILTVLGWAAIAILHFYLCKKITWLQYDIEVATDKSCYPPTNSDWLDTVMNCGGPFNVFPGIQVILLVIVMVYWLGLKWKLNAITTPYSEKWENKPLKR